MAVCENPLTRAGLFKTLCGPCAGGGHLVPGTLCRSAAARKQGKLNPEQNRWNLQQMLKIQTKSSKNVSKSMETNANSLKITANGAFSMKIRKIGQSANRWPFKMVVFASIWQTLVPRTVFFTSNLHAACL